MEHEVMIILNTISFALTFFYYYYELLVWGFSLFGFPHLPTVIYVKSNDPMKKCYTLSATLSIKIALFLAAMLGVIGSASWKLWYTIVSLIVCLPAVIYDIFLFIIGRFHWFDVDDFLLFQSLFTTTLRTFRIFATLSNLLRFVF